MEAQAESSDPIEGWGVLEVLGHRTLAGIISTHQVGGTALIRIDTYADGDKPLATQFYGAHTLYCLTPSDERTCRAMMRKSVYRPIQRYQLAMPNESESEPEEEFIRDIPF